MHYPRIKTFVIPDDVGPTHVGDYISDAVSKYLDDIGGAKYNPKSISVRNIRDRVYEVITYGPAYYLPPTLDIKGHPGVGIKESGVRENTLPVRGEDGPGKVNKAGAPKG